MQLILIFLLFFVSANAHAKEIQNYKEAESLYLELNVERIIDGDSIIASGKRIRLWGINAPEKNKPLFNISKIFLDEFLKEKTLRCKLIDFDKYKREVMHCYADDYDIGSIMVRLGLAKDFLKYSGGFYQREQGEAKTKLLGIWAIKTSPEEK